MLEFGSLFSGIGGLEYGLELSGLGRVVWQVEKDAKCRAVLAKHWPSVVRYHDVCTVGRESLRPVDLICGGFPCQDISSAGKRAGLSGARSGLWFEFRRVVSELRPAWVVVENVAGGACKWVDPVRESLEQLGYASLPIPVSASDCGAPHRRARVFIVARRVAATDAHNEARELDVEARGSVPTASRDSWWETEPDVARVVHGISRRLDDGADQQGDVSQARSASDLVGGKEVRSVRLDEAPAASPSRPPKAFRSRGALFVLPREGRPRDRGVGDGSTQAESVHGVRDFAHELQPHAREDVLEAVPGGSRQGERAKALGHAVRERMLGNAVVPAQAEVIGHVILELTHG